MKGKRLLCTLLALVILLGLIPLGSISAEAATALPDSIYLTQVGSSTCTLSATAMMLRARMYLSGNDLWRTISEQSIRSTAWIEGVGLRWGFTYNVQGNSMKVAHADASGISASQLKSLLDQHPEGIVLYCGRLPHAVFLTDYEGDTFYCAEPIESYSGKRIPLAESYLGYKYGTQETILARVTAYWYISTYSIQAQKPECSCSDAYAGTYLCTTSVTGLNVRSGHSTAYDIIGSVPPGATVKVTHASGTSNSDWAHIQYNGISGYASMQYLRKQTCEEAGHTYTDQETAPTCTTQGYVTYTCAVCGHSYQDHFMEAPGHNYEDGICTVCGQTDPDYQAPVTLIQWTGTSVNLGGALALNFAIDTTQLNGTTDNYIVLTRTFANGKAAETITLAQSEWTMSGTYAIVSYENLAAKEMGDEITAVVYNAAGEAISETRTDSMATYALRMLQNNTDTEQRTLFVDMLNYGAAAQVYFGYDAENLVNASLTEEQAGWASAPVDVQNYRQSGGCYVGSNLSLEEEIYLQVAFGAAYEEGMYATVSFTDHYDKQVEKRVDIEASGNYSIVRVEGMAIADYRSLVACKLYSADGTELGDTIDSMESYIARMRLDDLGDAIMKLGASSYAFFH